MKIWELRSSFDDYQSFQLLKYKEDKKYFEGKFNSTAILLDSWGEIFIECIEGDKPSDCPHFWGETGSIMISEQAKKLLEPLIGADVEFLPLVHNKTNEVYYVVHVLNVLDAIDSNKAIFKKLITGLVIGCEKFAFIPNIVHNEMIFKVYINQRIHPTSVFVSDELRNTILESDLKGFEFIEVWDSEANM
ncbi:imm11 family protein [Bacillus cereus group sp. MYBK71-2]|uniref:imm11 family protein n=1 Tax=Bacillus cereus group sp. MYBK71-2 TaxID=3450611 RepID=UPI003F78FBEA